MKKVRLKKPGANKGFSLIEVLAAIVILGLIAAPVLQMFYSSMAMNLKSKKYLAASELAQTAIENISSQTWKDNKPLTDNTTTIYGLDTYYNSEPRTGNNKKFFNSTYAPDAYIPEWITQSGDICITFRDISYGGYNFCALITFSNTNASEQYYVIPVTVSIYDPGDNPSGFNRDSSKNYAKLAEVSSAVANVK